MPEFQWYRTPIDDANGGTATEDSTLVAIWFDADPPADPSLYDLVIIDDNGDGLIGPDEWIDATGNAGTNARGDNGNNYLYNPEPGGGAPDGFLYSAEPITAGTTGLQSGLVDGFTPIDPANLDPTLICFAKGTWIETIEGRRRVEDLEEGELVLTKEHGYQPIRWIGWSRIPSLQLRMQKNLRSIRIRAHALGNSTPDEDLIVSAQHRVLVRSRIAERMFSEGEVLVAAKQLCALPGVEVVEGDDAVVYYHVLFDRHEIIYSNGAETESLFLGAEALKSLGPTARAEICALFPGLLEHQPTAPESARLLVPGRKGRQLAQRHLSNAKPLIDAQL